MPTRPTTPEQKEDAARLNALFENWLDSEQKRTGLRPSQEKVAHDLGVSQSALSQRLTGRMAINDKFAAKIARLIGCTVPDFSPRLDAEIKALAAGVNDPAAEFAQIRRVDVTMSAGYGALAYDEVDKSALSFRRDFLCGMGLNEKRCVVVTAGGHSMEPTIDDGAVLLINQAYTDITNGQIYAFVYDGLLFVKRLSRTKDGVVLARSDNPDQDKFPEMRIDHNTTDFEMIGKAVWMGVRL